MGHTSDGSKDTHEQQLGRVCPDEPEYERTDDEECAVHGARTMISQFISRTRTPQRTVCRETTPKTPQCSAQARGWLGILDSPGYWKADSVEKARNVRRKDAPGLDLHGYGVDVRLISDGVGRTHRRNANTPPAHQADNQR
jgi:hypothetical protein